jgi:hypothetical protein
VYRNCDANRKRGGAGASRGFDSFLACSGFLREGCNVFIDLATLVQWLPFATEAAGVWSTSFMLPNTPALIGAQVALQAALFPTAAPLGIDITNGLLETLGGDGRRRPAAREFR